MSGERSVSRPRIGQVVVIATLALNVFALAMPLVILQLFDRVIPFSSYETLMMLLLCLVSVAIFETVLRISRVVVLGAKAEEYELDLVSDFTERTLDADPSEYARTTNAEHVERFGSIGQLRDFYAGPGRLASIELPFACLFIAMIGLIGGWLVLVPLTSVAAVFLFTKVLIRAQEPIFEERKTLDARRYAFLIEVLSQVNTVKLNTMERQMLRRFEMIQDKALGTSERMILFSGLSQSFGAIFAQAALILMAVVGSFLVINNHIGLAELAACMLLNGRTIQPFVKMLGVWSQSEGVAASERKLAAALEIPALFEEQPTELAHPLDANDIQVFDATIHLPGSDQPTVSGLSLRVRDGGCIALSGSDVSANTALMRAVFAELPLARGDILIGGKPVSEVGHMRGENGLVYVSRRPVILNGTILQNISGFGDGAQIEYALSLAQAIGLEDTVAKIPMGYNTVLDEGSRFILDASSLKLVCLVRALALRPSVLLLEDPTFNLDWNGARRFATVLAEHTDGMTRIIATEDARLIDLADEAIEIRSQSLGAGPVEAPDQQMLTKLGTVA